MDHDVSGSLGDSASSEENKELGTHESNSYVYRAVNKCPKAGLP